MNSRVVVTKDRRNHWLDMKNNRRGEKKKTMSGAVFGGCLGKLFRDYFQILWDF